MSPATWWFNTVTPHCALQDEHIKWVKQELTTVDTQQKVKEYNAQINSNLFMNMVSSDDWLQMHAFFKATGFFIQWNIFYFTQQNKDGSYTGFIKVQFKLARPVSVPPPKKGVQDAGRRKASGVKRRTSFYLPKDASKHLHISSRTSAREVIEVLLKKFTVIDNPAKFALFERSERHDQGITPLRYVYTLTFCSVFKPKCATWVFSPCSFSLCSQGVWRWESLAPSSVFWAQWESPQLCSEREWNWRSQCEWNMNFRIWDRACVEFTPVVLKWGYLYPWWYVKPLQGACEIKLIYLFKIGIH